MVEQKERKGREKKEKERRKNKLAYLLMAPDTFPIASRCLA